MSNEDNNHYLSDKDLEVLKVLKDVDKEAWQDYAIELLIELHTKGDIPPPPDCPAGRKWDPELERCILICPEGQKYDPDTDTCVPINPPPTCDEYETYDEATNKCIPPKLPNDGREQFHKGASLDTSTWRVVNMLDDPSLFKIVDNANINVADEFHTKENAEQFITYYKWLALKQGKCKELGKVFDPVKNECIDKDQPTGDKIYPDSTPPHECTNVTDGEKEQGGDRREPQIACGFNFLNTEATAYIRTHDVNDTLSIKLRGPKHSGIPDDHMCNNIHYISLGNENKKPFGKQSGHTKEYCAFGSPVVKIPDNVWVGIKAIEWNSADNKSVHFQTWIQNPEGSEWKLAAETIDSGNTGCGSSDPRAGKPYTTSPCQDVGHPVSIGFRVDGLKGGGDVEFKKLSVREINPYGGIEPCQPQTCPQGQHWDSNLCKCVDDNPQPTGDFPYKAIGQPMQSSTRGPTTRHYSSGKPDDNTIEKNTKSIKYKNYQCVVDITNDCEWAHDDTFSIKLGGRHTKEGWLDNGLGVFSGQCCLGTEKKHPSTQLCVIKGPKIGDTRGKRFKLACTYFTDQNKTELWTNFGSGWVKQMEGTNVNNFNPNSPEDEFQLRIDGFKEKNKPPTIHSAVVTEIAPSSSSVAAMSSGKRGKGKEVDCGDGN